MRMPLDAMLTRRFLSESQSGVQVQMEFKEKMETDGNASGMQIRGFSDQEFMPCRVCEFGI